LFSLRERRTGGDASPQSKELRKESKRGNQGNGRRTRTVGEEEGTVLYWREKKLEEKSRTSGGLRFEEGREEKVD